MALFNIESSHLAVIVLVECVYTPDRITNKYDRIKKSKSKKGIIISTIHIMILSTQLSIIRKITRPLFSN